MLRSKASKTWRNFFEAILVIPSLPLIEIVGCCFRLSVPFAWLAASAQAGTSCRDALALIRYRGTLSAVVPGSVLHGLLRFYGVLSLYSGP